MNLGWGCPAIVGEELQPTIPQEARGSMHNIRAGFTWQQDKRLCNQLNMLGTHPTARQTSLPGQAGGFPW